MESAVAAADVAAGDCHLLVACEGRAPDAEAAPPLSTREGPLSSGSRRYRNVGVQKSWCCVEVLFGSRCGLCEDVDCAAALVA